MTEGTEPVPDLEAPPVERRPRPTLATPAPEPIAPTDSFAVAGRKAMWPHAERMLRFEADLADPAKTDSLKRYRVAIRRLRAALRLFGGAFPDRRVTDLRAALGELGRAAGTPRDLDVRMADIRRWAADREGGGAKAAVEPLLRQMQRERDSAMDALLRSIGSRRHEKLLREVAALVDGTGKPWPGGARAVRDAVGSRVWRAFEDLREAGSVLRWTDLPGLHEIRIDAKRLRYALEFLADVLGPQRPWLVERLVALQDHFGALNDAAVASDAVRAALADRHAAFAPLERAVVAEYLRDRERELARLRRGVGRPWRSVGSQTFARRLAAAVVIP